eukprot:c10359_g1_i2.p1 GENE.c10359_g1_i2~~c10359_g1_i2.p1  ORF type:complete len:148 (-),score=14.42 c10359_g1_i2:95-538(-)
MTPDIVVLLLFSVFCQFCIFCLCYKYIYFHIYICAFLCLVNAAYFIYADFIGVRGYLKVGYLSFSGLSWGLYRQYQRALTLQFADQFAGLIGLISILIISMLGHQNDLGIDGFVPIYLVLHATFSFYVNKRREEIIPATLPNNEVSA